tara:strand:+ start:1433 stop:1690 length:258 start_codon:yes stop_codon:yes gene_type:complete
MLHKAIIKYSNATEAYNAFDWLQREDENKEFNFHWLITITPGTRREITIYTTCEGERQDLIDNLNEAVQMEELEEFTRCSYISSP